MLVTGGRVPAEQQLPTVPGQRVSQRGALPRRQRAAERRLRGAPIQTFTGVRRLPGAGTRVRWLSENRDRGGGSEGKEGKITHRQVLVGLEFSILALDTLWNRKE